MKITLRYKTVMNLNPLLLLLLPLLLLAACAVQVTFKGLKPVYPEYPESYTWHYGNPYDLVCMEVDSLQPTLKWESFPRLRYLQGGTEKLQSRISNVTYELKVMGTASELVYVRKGLVEPSHKIEIPLLPLTKYLWSVRSRFELDGRPKVTGWGEMTIEVKAKNYLPQNFLYSFKTPEVK
jgi:hypothetical protein